MMRILVVLLLIYLVATVSFPLGMVFMQKSRKTTHLCMAPAFRRKSNFAKARDRREREDAAARNGGADFKAGVMLREEERLQKIIARAGVVPLTLTLTPDAEFLTKPDR